MKVFLFSIIILFVRIFQTNANISFISTTSQCGITVNYLHGSKNNRFTMDSILNIVNTRLEGRDTNLKILVILNYGTLLFPDPERSSFFSIGYDTLREFDDRCIMDYYWKLDSISNKIFGRNIFLSETYPLDINYTDDINPSQEVGIKIICDDGYEQRDRFWDELIKAIVYAGENPDSIRIQQKRFSVELAYNSWNISLVSLDTSRIYQIIGRQPIDEKRNSMHQKEYFIPGVWRYILVGILLLIVSYFLIRK